MCSLVLIVCSLAIGHSCIGALVHLLHVFYHSGVTGQLLFPCLFCQVQQALWSPTIQQLEWRKAGRGLRHLPDREQGVRQKLVPVLPIGLYHFNVLTS